MTGLEPIFVSCFLVPAHTWEQAEREKTATSFHQFSFLYLVTEGRRPGCARRHFVGFLKAEGKERRAQPALPLLISRIPSSANPQTGAIGEPKARTGIAYRRIDMAGIWGGVKRRND